MDKPDRSGATLTHHLDQAIAAHSNGDADTVQRVYDRMHAEGLCQEAHQLITALNRYSAMVILSAAVALEVSTSTVCRSVLTPPGPGGHPSVGGS